jgi:hypothetical protein
MKTKPILSSVVRQKKSDLIAKFTLTFAIFHQLGGKSGR